MNLLFLHLQTVVSIPHLAAFHSERNFADPESFIPERFLGDPRFVNDNKDVFQPFSFGPRNCIGRKYVSCLPFPFFFFFFFFFLSFVLSS